MVHRPLRSLLAGTALAVLTGGALLVASTLPAAAQQPTKKTVDFATLEEGVEIKDTVGSYHHPAFSTIQTRIDPTDSETLQLKEDLVPKIGQSVAKAPF